MKIRPDPAQLLLPTFCPPVVIPQGDGSVIVRPGKPIAWLTPAQFAQAVSLSRDSVYRYVGTALIPDHLVEYVGDRKMRIAADAVRVFLSQSKALRLGT